jgi:hypothetical protein
MQPIHARDNAHNDAYNDAYNGLAAIYHLFPGAGAPRFSGSAHSQRIRHQEQK